MIGRMWGMSHGIRGIAGIASLKKFFAVEYLAGPAWVPIPMPQCGVVLSNKAWELARKW